MFSMPERLGDAHHDAADVPGRDGRWLDLAGLEARLPTRAARRRVCELDTRHARRAARRVLRDVRTALDAPQPAETPTAPQDATLAVPPANVVGGLGVVCESCRRAPATRRVMFADLVVFAVCACCAGGAVGVAA